MKQPLTILALAALSLSGAAHAATYDLPPEGNDVVGSVSTIVATHEDTLVDIARRHGVGYRELVHANPDVHAWLPGEGTEIVIPTRYVLPAVPRRGIVLNLAEYRLYYFPEPAAGETPVVMTFPISIGRMDWETPIGKTAVVSKVTNPSWYPPQSVREEHAAEGRPLPSIVPPGPNNPLGKHAMRLALPGYLIHGTNRPAGVGMRVTHGCLRMFPEDIEHLFGLVAVNTPVRIINDPVKIGWQDDQLVMEVHPVLESAPALTADEAAAVAGGDPADGIAQADADDGVTDIEIVTAVDGATDVGTAAADDGIIDVETAAAGDGVPGVEADDDVSVEQLADEAADRPPATDDVVEPEFEPPVKDALTYVTEQFIVATDERPGLLDWNLVEEVVDRADGMPVTVGEGIKNAAASAASE